MNGCDTLVGEQGGLRYLGLAPFLRASIAGVDLRPVTQQLLEALAQNSANANLLMNLSLAAQCLGQQEVGLTFQHEALALQRSYTVAASQQPARLRLLVLVTEGSMQSNTPLECLLEVSDIELVFHYLMPADANETGLLANLPAHDLLFVGISESDANRALLQALERLLANWPQPVLNAPQYLPHTGREQASRLLQGVPHLLAPATRRVSRADLVAVPMDFPLILRPVGSQAGADLQRVDSASAVAHYLAHLEDTEFFVAPFIDYSDARGLFRKIRIAFIAGETFVCHMAVSSHWMVHYVNAGMYEEPWKREEEARFMDDFAQFVARHRQALQAIAERMQLDYLVMDCAETQAGELLLFEIDHGGVVHAMDVASLFPYKNAHIDRAKQAFCQMLYARLPRLG